MQTQIDQLKQLSIASIQTTIMEKINAFCPILIRFRSKPQDKTKNYEEQTGILCGCKNVSGRFDFGIYYKDPLEIQYAPGNRRSPQKATESGSSPITIIQQNERVYKIFNGPAFTMTCYYLWDNNGNNSSDKCYVRDFYSGTDLQLIPGDDSSWTKTDLVFPKEVRNVSDYKVTCKFLNDNGPIKLPFKNDSLLKILPDDHNVSNFIISIHGRRSLPGRGIPKKIQHNPSDPLDDPLTDPPTKQRKSKNKKEENKSNDNNNIYIAHPIYKYNDLLIIDNNNNNNHNNYNNNNNPPLLNYCGSNYYGSNYYGSDIIAFNSIETFPVDFLPLPQSDPISPIQTPVNPQYSLPLHLTSLSPTHPQTYQYPFPLSINSPLGSSNTNPVNLIQSTYSHIESSITNQQNMDN